jgi:protein-tyrosine phosphatase
LYVCTGNICRSPVAERLLLHGISADADIFVHSAGISALEGEPIWPPMAEALRGLGGDDVGHAARWLDEELIADADLILGASRIHRDRVLSSTPTVLRKTFTMKEFVRLGSALASPDMPDTPTAIVAAVAARRGTSAAVAASDDEVADPYGESIEVVRTCIAEIADNVQATAQLLRIGR